MSIPDNCNRHSLAFPATNSAGREKVKVFGAWLDADIAGRKAGQGNRAEGLKARADRGEELTDQEVAEVRAVQGSTKLLWY